MQINTTWIMGERPGAFAQAMQDAAPGDHIVYHIGQNCGGVHRHDARAAYMAGLVLLTTRRSIDGMFEYIAVRAKPNTRAA